jgi:hypothetical protein
MKNYLKLWWHARYDNHLLFYGVLLGLVLCAVSVIILILQRRKRRRVKREEEEKKQLKLELARIRKKEVEKAEGKAALEKAAAEERKAKQIEKKKREIEEAKRKEEARTAAEAQAKTTKLTKAIKEIPIIETPVKPTTIKPPVVIKEEVSKIPAPTETVVTPELIKSAEGNKKRVTSTPYITTTEVETVVIKSVPDEGHSEAKRIGYIPSSEYCQAEPYIYAVAKMPRPNSIIKFPRNGRSDKKGYKEDDFFQHLKQHFAGNFIVSNDKHVPTKSSRPYEPDFILINERGNKNIFINIEIDEPYDGFTRTPTHCLYENDIRDQFFTNRGWIVIRFAEIQVHLQPTQCCAYIAKVISSINPEFESDLLNVSTPDGINQWESLQAKKWAREQYREIYLGIENFGSRSKFKTEYEITDSKADQDCEKDVPKLKTPVQTASHGLAVVNSNSRDKRVKFDHIEHRYFIDGNPDTLSVTQLIDKFFPEFDSAYWAPIKAGQRGIPTFQILEEWESKRDKAAYSGTALHEAIENYYNGREHDTTTPEFQHFLSFKQRFNTMIPYRSEWRIFDEDLLVAGTVDMVYQKDDESLYMFDWKRSEKVVDLNGNPIENNYQTAFGELSHLGDSSYNKYCLQQNIYKAILEKRYNKKISSMNLLILHEKYDRYYLITIPNMEDEIAYIMNYALRRR